LVKNLIATSSKDPSRSMAAALYKEIIDNSAKSRFVKTMQSTFGVSDHAYKKLMFLKSHYQNGESSETSNIAVDKTETEQIEIMENYVVEKLEEKMRNSENTVQREKLPEKVSKFRKIGKWGNMDVEERNEIVRTPEIESEVSVEDSESEKYESD